MFVYVTFARKNIHEIYIYIYIMGVQNQKITPQNTYFIHVKTLQYESQPVSILADHNLY